MLDDYPLNDDVSRDVLNSEIVLRCGLLTPLYSEPDTMHAAIVQWFKSREWTIEHLVRIIKAQYSPIENTDYTLETSRQIYESGTSGNSRTLSSSGSRNANSTTTRDLDGTVSNNNTRTDKVSAYDSGSFANSSQTEGYAGGTTGEDETTQVYSSETSTDGGSITDTGSTSGNSADTYKETKHGNIGVTTNQQLINQELAMLANYTIYKWLAMQLEGDLFIMVY